jgi:hypothetical protein
MIADFWRARLVDGLPGARTKRGKSWQVGKLRLHCRKMPACRCRCDQYAGNGSHDSRLIAPPTTAQPMKSRLRYLCALLINVAMPWLAYRLAFPHWGQAGALVASAVPLIAWMSWDLARYRHFDALSAQVLVGIVLSLAATLLVALVRGDARIRSLESPMVSGMIGVSFLVSLALHRPLVFYLARSTMARADHRGAELFEKHWRERPTLAAYIRLMTIVWGIGMIGENLLRIAVVWQWPDNPRSTTVSNLIGYAVYACLTLWTFWCRRLIKRDALRYAPDETSSLASS